MESKRRKSSNKQDGDPQIGIDTETLTEIVKAGLNPGRVAVAQQQIALKLYEEEQKQKLAKPKKKKQEMIEHQKRVQKAKDELQMEDWSSLDVSLLDIEKQKKLFEEATHEKKLEKLHETVAQQIRLQDEEEKRVRKAAQPKGLLEDTVQQQKEDEAARQKRVQEEAARQQKEEADRCRRAQEEAARQKRAQEEAAWQQKEEADRRRRAQEEAARQKEAQEEAARQDRLQQNNKTCKTYGANKNKHDDDSQSDEFFDASNTWLDKVQQNNPPADGDITSSDTYNPAHFGDQPHGKAVTVQPHSKQDNKPVRSPDPHPSNDNPHNLELGSLIQFGNPPCYGVIKWIGSIPEANCVMAGVEVVRKFIYIHYICMSWVCYQMSIYVPNFIILPFRLTLFRY